MTEPDWAVVQEVETVTGDFLTEPGVPFYRIVIDGYCADFDHRQAAENFVAAIQRAFEERERKLRGQLTFIQQSHDWMYGEKQRLENALKDIASRAHAHLATRQDAPVTENRHEL